MLDAGEEPAEELELTISDVRRARRSTGLTLTDIAEQAGNSPAENARMFAMASVAQADETPPEVELRHDFRVDLPVTLILGSGLVAYTAFGRDLFAGVASKGSTTVWNARSR